MISYEQDLYAWTLDNVALLRTRQFDKLDVDNLIEELEYMARKDKKELVNRLAILLMHLLKWQFQPDKRTRSWRNTIIEQREEILELLAESPSLRYEISIKLAEAYKKARRKAEDETNIDQKNFPPTCPYTVEQALDDDFYPESEVLL
jgi:hypothetical protein